MPVDPARLNAVGDLVLRDAGEMHALADPLRLTLFDAVRRQGPITTAALASSYRSACSTESATKTGSCSGAPR
jgi:hypothetical protein